MGELFEWHKGTHKSTMHVLVDGRRVASIERASDQLREAWLPPFWEPPVPGWALRWVGLSLLTLALLALAWRLEVPAQAARRPLPVAVSLALAVALVPGQVAWGSPPPPSGVVKRWFVEDHVGSASLVLDAQGNVVERRVFEPFGKVFAQTGTLSAPRFTGKRSAPEADTLGLGSLYDFGARWYDAELGRFQQIDPIVQSPLAPVTLNAYAYAGNDPVNNVDPDGRSFAKILIIIGFAVLAVAMMAAGLGGLGIQAGIIGMESAAATMLSKVVAGALATNTALDTIANAVPGQQGPVDTTPLQDAAPVPPAPPRAPSPASADYVWDFGWIKILGSGPNAEQQPHEGWIEGVLWAVPLSRLFRWIGGARAAETALTHAERQVLRDTFGRGPEGAKRVLGQLGRGTFEPPRDLTRSALDKYRQVAQRAIDQGIDKIGTQRLRRDIIDRILRDYGHQLPP